MRNLPQRLLELRDTLLDGLIERDVAVRLALLAVLSGEHLLLIGPPGTAKSLIARRLNGALASGAYFERLLTRFSVPEELFGPLSIKALEQDRYERLTEAYLPQASIAFLDEIFKANSAILNALLTLLNEREFDNGAQRLEAPLVSVVGASNELPEGEELDALFDRFLLRLHVGSVSSQGFYPLLGLRGERPPTIPSELRLDPSELATLRTRRESVDVPDDVVALLAALREWCAAEQVFVSDRRWRKIVGLLQMSALTNGRSSVSVWDCWLLQHCVWSTPEQRNDVFEWYAARVGASRAMNPERLTQIVVRWEAKLERDQQSRAQAQNAKGQLLYLTPKGTTTTDAKGEVPQFRDREPLYLAPPQSHWYDGYSFNEIEDRTNGNKGYLRAELDNRCHIRNSRRYQDFSGWNERDTYLANPNNRLLSTGEHPPKIEPARFKAMYIDGCVEQLIEFSAEVDDYRSRLQEHINTLETELRSHLWVTDDFIGPASQSLNQTSEVVESLLRRLDRVAREFDMLPRELTLEADDPQEA